MAQQARPWFLQCRQRCPRAGRQILQPGVLLPAEVPWGVQAAPWHVSCENHREHEPRKLPYLPRPNPSPLHAQRPFVPSRCSVLISDYTCFQSCSLVPKCAGPMQSILSVYVGSYLYFITLLCIDSCCHPRSSQQLTTLTF